MRPALLVIAGPNGSGKTTVTERLREDHWSEGVEYLNPDDIAQQRFGDWNSSDAVMKAARWTTARREELLLQRAGIAFETVMSAPDKITFLERAKDAGYFVRVFFIGTKDVRINAARIAQHLERAVMLGIDRQQTRPCTLGGGLHNLAGADQAFLVGQRNRRAAIDRGKGRPNRRRTDDSGHDPVSVALRGFLKPRFSRASLHARAGQCVPQLTQLGWIGERHKTGLQRPRQFGEPGDIAARRERFDFNFRIAAGA